jgi:hypothetical protein
VLFRSAIPQQQNLILILESLDFDSSVSGSGSTIPTWYDKSGNNHNFTDVLGGMSSGDHGPALDTIRTLNGHRTLRFSLQTSLTNTQLFIPTASISGLEICCIFKQDQDPPIGYSSTAFQFTQVYNHWNGAPYFNWNADPAEHPTRLGGIWGNPEQHWVETFGNGWDSDLSQQDKLDIGTSSYNSATNFIIYNISSKADGTSYDAWINDNYFYHGSGSEYKYISRGRETMYTLGGGVRYGSGGSFSYMQGNIAAVYLWKTNLSDVERIQLRRYIANTWGLSFIN